MQLTFLNSLQAILLITKNFVKIFLFSNIPIVLMIVLILFIRSGSLDEKFTTNSKRLSFYVIIIHPAAC